MKRFKIVQHFTSNSDHMFRIYERKHLFFWQWLTSYTTIERCEQAISEWLAEEQAQRDEKASIPADKVIGYV